jgi:hypothetical protein
MAKATKALNFGDFVAMTPEQIRDLTNGRLAALYTEAIKLHHRARLEGNRYQSDRDPSLPSEEQTRDLEMRLMSEIERRGKRWQISLVGESWLDDEKGNRNDSAKD